MAKKEIKIVFSKRFSEQVDDILERGDRKAFNSIAEAIKKIKENPEAGTRIWYEYNSELIKKIEMYKGKKIEKVGIWNYGLHEERISYDLNIKDIVLELHGSKTFDKNYRELEKKNLKSLVGRVFSGIDYVDDIRQYGIVLDSDKPTEVIIFSLGIALSN